MIHFETNKFTAFKHFQHLIMVVTIEQSIPMNSRGFFLRERDAITAQYNVQLKFPKGRQFMHGEHQTMLMVGLQSNITKLMPKVREILDNAHEQYMGYKERQARRRRNAPHKVSVVSKAVKSEAPKPRVNAFAALDGLFEQEQEAQRIEIEKKQKAAEIKAAKQEQKQREKDAIEAGLAPKPTTSEKCTMNYAAMAAKPAMPVEKETIQIDNTVVKNKWMFTTSWGDMCDEEDDWEN